MAMSFTAVLLWEKQPAPDTQPPTQAIPSIRFVSLSPFCFFNNATLHASIPLQISGFSTTSSLFSSFHAWTTASVTPLDLAKFLP